MGDFPEAEHMHVYILLVNRDIEPLQIFGRGSHQPFFRIDISERLTTRMSALFSRLISLRFEPLRQFPMSMA